VWSWNRAVGSVTVVLAYQCIAFSSHIGDLKWWYKLIWKVNIPSKVICFIWLCLKDKILTGANYKKRGGIGPVVCTLCLQDDETTNHLLIQCEVTRNIWKEILNVLNLPDAWRQTTLEENLLLVYQIPKSEIYPFLGLLENMEIQE
jgi:hypothetical protein